LQHPAYRWDVQNLSQAIEPGNVKASSYMICVKLRERKEGERGRERDKREGK